MSKYFSKKYDLLTPYTPGEQPRDMKYIKLNTNESPFLPSKLAIEYAKEEMEKLQLYSDPECKALIKQLAINYNVGEENIIVTNGSDEVLNFAFMAYCDKNVGAAFANITYGFYPVFAKLNNIDYIEIPLKDDFSIQVSDYYNLNRTIFIANPNAPTGIALSIEQIEDILKNNKNNIVVIDEAYVDFGAESAVNLIDKYDNLIVTMTFSKSRSMAGARLGFAFANKNIIKDLNTIRYSTNPYNVNRMTLAAGIGALKDNEYMLNNANTIIKNREYTKNELLKLGFEVLDSKANFIFAKSNLIDGEVLYKKLKEKGVLVRHFNKEIISQYVRITIGLKEQMDILIDKIKIILEEDLNENC